MLHLTIIFILGVLVGMYMGKTLKSEESKQRKIMKISLDILIIFILIILMIGVYGFIMRGEQLNV